MIGVKKLKMLKFVKKINISAADFYNAILLSLVQDVKKATGKTISVADLEYGYKCQSRVKRRGKVVESKINIGRPVLNKEIVTTITVQQSTYEMKYTIEELSENSIRVTHIQTGSVSDNFLNRILFKNKTNRSFKEIEKKLKQAKKETEK